MCFVFFFSSRRRHTRCGRDWSSDVCSSDLAVLTETGLAGAIQALVERCVVPVTVTEVPRERFPAVIEATVYFVVSEALANVAKHARAGNAQVSISRFPGRLAVRVSDDG